MPNSPAEIKHALRRQMRLQRRAISLPDRVRLEQAWVEHALASHWFYPTQRVAAYIATGSELSLRGLLDLALARGILLYLPRVLGATSMEFGRFHGQPLHRGKFGIAEPHGVATPLNELDAILLPLLAVDDLGQRLGQGGGYYDRILSAAPGAVRIGVAFDAQLLAQSLPTETFDQRLDALITPSGTRVFIQNHRAEVRFPAQG